MPTKNEIQLQKQLEKVRNINLRVTLKEHDITVPLLEEASMIMAEIIKKYGDLYIPIFVRVLEEIESRKKSKSYKEIALQMLNTK